MHDLAGQDRSADLDMNTRRHFRSIANHPAVRRRATDLGTSLRRILGWGRKQERQPRQHQSVSAHELRRNHAEGGCDGFSMALNALLEIVPGSFDPNLEVVPFFAIGGPERPQLVLHHCMLALAVINPLAIGELTFVPASSALATSGRARA